MVSEGVDAPLLRPFLTAPEARIFLASGAVLWYNFKDNLIGFPCRNHPPFLKGLFRHFLCFFRRLTHE